MWVLAQAAGRLIFQRFSFQRFCLVEYCGMDGIVSAATAVVIGEVADTNMSKYKAVNFIYGFIKKDL